MKGFFGMFNGSADEQNKQEMKNNGEPTVNQGEEQKLRLRKEELDIAKNKVDIGKVEFGKEIIEEQQTVNVPVIHEEVVIERKSINEPSDKPIGEDEDEHFILSVSAEKVDVGKHTVVTSEISAYKRDIEENQEINETIRHEEARINKDGDANIIDDNGQLQ
ncbi:MAG: YsnF/AvaK domain-containing protein [Syntrophomonadaceae bacterium]|nr:YsnF/AvaK domain-containing protein [Syntrophomonadaceae bacterium]